MGIGMTLIVAAEQAAAILMFIRARKMPAWEIGTVEKGTGISRVV